MAFTVNQCCGLSLKTGTIIIGVLSAVAALSAISNGIVSFSTPLMTPEMAKDLNVTEEFRENYNTVVSTSSHINTAAFIIMFIQLLFSVMLVFGANNGKPSLMQPWIIYSILNLFLASIVYFILMAVLFIYVTAGAGIILLVTLLIYVALSSYFIIVVNSFYRVLTEGRSVFIRI